MTLHVATEFSATPGHRCRSDGPDSAEAFRDELLRPRFEAAERDSRQLLVDLDGGAGYAAGFLEEAFGGLARLCSPERVLQVLQFKSDEEPYLRADILQYIRECSSGAKLKS